MPLCYVLEVGGVWSVRVCECAAAAKARHFLIFWKV